MLDSWHTEIPQNIVKRLNTSLVTGLTTAQSQNVLNKIGPNLIIKQKITSSLKIFIKQFSNLVIFVLLSAVVISYVLGEKTDAIAIFAIVILNTIIGFFLEYRADRAIFSLQKMAAPRATVLRDGHTTVILASNVVPGDILLLKSGDLIAADARLFEVSSLKTNDAPLTGESLPVEKSIQLCSAEAPLADRKNMVFMGTTVVDGTGRAIVINTGMETEMGRIAHLLEEASHAETPLQKSLNQIGRHLLWICFSIIGLVFLLGLLRNIPFFLLFMSSISLAVAAIPEGLPAVVTVALALGVQRMVRRAVLVRHLSAVETMGCLQVICTDKTGTLTVGEMTGRKLITNEHVYTIHGQGYTLSGDFVCQNKQIFASNDRLLLSVLHAAVACNNAEIISQDSKLSVIGDPTEIALLIVAAKGGVWRDSLESRYPRLKELPFNAERKRMSTICSDSNQYHVFVKGAPEVILDRCTHILLHNGIKKITSDDRVRMRQSCELMASEALRVLAFAERTLTASLLIDEIDDRIENNLVFLGLIGLQDPPHATAKESVEQCIMAGIKPVMITGDHPNTARAIAQELGILDSCDQLITGNELEKISDEDFIKRVKQITVYARATAEHKLKIVRAWKKQQYIIAMTGDGINDAPALKEASVGIAMGITGTAVTKEAADIIVLDNNFTSIVTGIEEGRAIYDNISKALAYLLAGNSGELMVMFVALLIGLPLPLLPIQLLWINLITDGLPAIALATDISEPEILKRPPRHPQKPFMDKFFFQHVVFVGFLTSLVTLGIFTYEYLSKGNLFEARDAAFTVLVMAELLRAFGARSYTKPIWQLGLFSNLRLFFIISISFLLQLIIHYIPALQKIFGVASLSLKQCLIWTALAMMPPVILEIQKLIKTFKDKF